MKFRIYSMNDNGSGIGYNTKKEFLEELSRMIDDCEANGGTYFDAEVYFDKRYFHIDKETMADLFGKNVDELACHNKTSKKVED